MIHSGATWSVRSLLVAAGAALIGGFGLAAPVTAHASVVQAVAAPDHLPAAPPRIASEVDTVSPGTASRAEFRVAGSKAEAPGIFYLSAGRIGSTVAGLLGLAGAAVGALALARRSGRFGIDTGSLGARISLTAGLIGMAVGGVVAATSDAGIGTGNGRAGAYVAVAIGLISVVLGGLASSRARRSRITG